MGLVFKVRVKCPKCGREFSTTTIKTVKCRWCNHSFTVFPKRGRSRIVKIEEGSLQLLWKLRNELLRKKKLDEGLL